MNNQTSSIDSIINSAFAGVNVKNSENADAVATLLDKYGLRWEVSKQSLQLPSGEETGFYGIVRQDTKQTFSTCKDTYSPFQNSELAELLIRISENTGYNIHSGGMFNGGGKVYLQLDTHNEIKGLGKNGTTVKGFVTGINSHDGTTSLKWGAVNFTVCCRNTFAMANKKLQQSARHTTNMRDRVEESIRQITGIAEAEKTIFDSFILLADQAVKKEHIATIVRNITEVDINLNKKDAADKFSTYAINRTNELLNSISVEMNQKGQNLWGLFSGVTHYTSHVLSVPKRENARLESKYTGSGLTIDNEAYETIINF